MQSVDIITDIEKIRSLLRSDVSRIVIEAPAGCGKTYEAVSLACDIGSALPDASVLLLTHTNSAKNEFARRAATAKGANRVRISTIDSFLLDLCSPHAAALGLPFPLRVALSEGSIDISALGKKALDLLNRSPIVAQVLRVRYPVIILDEHQDASTTQNEVIEVIARSGGVRTRSFGDPMQAIYDFDGDGVDWENLKVSADAICMLTIPWRWTDKPQLGAWINDARKCLAQQQPLPPIPQGTGVSVSIIQGVGDPGYAQHLDSKLVAPLWAFESDSSCAVLTYTNKRANALAMQTGGSFTLNEGAELKLARDTILAMCVADGDAQRLAAIVVQTLGAAAVGFDATKREQCLAALKPTALNIGRKKQVASVLESLADIYLVPSVMAACRALGKIVQSPPEWLKRIQYPRNVEAIVAVADSSDHPQEAIESIIAHGRQAKVVRRTISTVHKAKGLEYEAVMLWNFSAVDFPIDEERARLLYVAISRPTQRLVLLAPGLAVSPFAEELESVRKSSSED